MNFSNPKRARLVFLLLSVLAVWGTAEVSRAEKTTYIKFATLAPEGSSWMNEMHKLDKEVQRASGGNVRFKFYPGGVSGDEKDVIRKMRIGQLHAAGFTGVGLGEILPEVRVLDLPFLFENDRQIERIYETMDGHFARKFEEKGYVLLGWVPVGWIHFFSKYDIKSLDDLKQTKPWMWEGDPLVREAYAVLNVSPFPLSVTDVLMSLQTGIVDTVYSSPLGALALQWSAKTAYMSQVRMGNSTGAVLMPREQFDRVPAEYREPLRAISRKYLKELARKIQEDNAKSIDVMLKNGLRMGNAPSEAELKKFHEIGAAVRKNLTGKLFPQELLDQVLAHLREAK
ncbi:MAG: TRAP transporter substrate-binding protein DctP [Nitrospinae bacterium]|nr:TRAP transporter substrate-binding protein DctP [Nitrospinota bacterium]